MIYVIYPLFVFDWKIGIFQQTVFHYVATFSFIYPDMSV